ncbi:hypothetical protein LCGC14_2930760 [marine sediment metagenome]|uniref:Uncharacterized protein n=1 Tax=marine sediment metagenome TaxID=412755 RepID=A0A0F8Y7X5_9ZZZZ
MKKIAILLVLFIFTCSLAFGDIDFREKLNTSRAWRTTGWIGGGAGLIITTIAFFMALSSSQDIYAFPTGAIILGGIGGGLVGGGVGIGLHMGNEVKRWEHALKFGHSFTDRELRAIEEKKIFIGMSEPALIASWGLPGDINKSAWKGGSSEQYVYRRGEYKGQYVYIEDNLITGFN